MQLLKTADGLDTYYSEKYKQTYHSKNGVLQEARHVFLEKSGVSEKFKSQEKINILEIGFGTGFNFFLTSGEALKNKTALEYYSVENNLMDYKDFSVLNHGKLFSENPVWRNFLSWRRYTNYLKSGVYRMDQENIRLILILLDARDMEIPDSHFDAVYHDAFSPEMNPELWTVTFFNKIKDTMKQGALLTTYSAKGAVRRSLIKAGFKVDKCDGPMGKREMLIACKM